MRTIWCLLAILSPSLSVCDSWTWTRLPQSLTRATLQGVSFSGSLTGIITSQDGRILRTVDGGKKWAEVYRGKNAWNRIASRGGIIAAAGTGQVAISVDGGATFRESVVPSRVTLQGVDVDRSGTIWVCGMAGRVYSSADRGGSWNDVSPGRPEGLMFVRVLGNGMVISGGKSGLWARTVDGKWGQSPLKSGHKVIDAGEDSRGGVWMLARYRDKARIWRCKDIRMGCDEMSDDESEMSRLAIGDRNLWLNGGETGVLVRLPMDGYILQQENMPGYKGVMMTAGESPDGTVWAVGEKGAVFRGVPVAVTAR